ncbi:Gamma interferon inducible lysosomal thiol reductase GILT [Cinara cedri]|uniref:Gamma interferon inducible lysosomal thiol reductase GILT n=1 Tax=Cinara cedri TaxID=506608 RepID=A0A5E4NJR0_9HEMI|nr:Gamma interferon inducible lysosomal thiol reductase GILT [Cinara cedri]
MITSIFFPIFFLLIIISKSTYCTVDSGSGVKNIQIKPSLQHDFPTVENQNSVPKITVSVYYGSLCSECVDLFVHQIGPNLVKFHKYVNFDFVPFGNAEKKSFDGRWYFKCKNGPDECSKNKWQACSIHILPSKLQLLANYLVCYMNSTDKILSGYQCTRKLGMYSGYYGKIKKCFINRELSDSLMIYHSNRTRTVLPTQSTVIPYIVFNGVYNEFEQDDAKNNLRNVICKYLHPKPTEIC